MRKEYSLDKELNDEQIKEIEKGAKNPLCFTFAIRLRELLIKRKISQDKLAENAKCCTASSISVYLQAKQEPRAEILAGFAKVLDVSVDFLLGLTDCENPQTNIRAIHNSIGLSGKAIQILYRQNRAAGRTITKTLSTLIEQEDINWDSNPTSPLILSAIQNYLETSVDEKTEYKLTKNTIELFRSERLEDYYGTLNTIPGKSIVDMVYFEDIKNGLKEIKNIYYSDKGGTKE